MTEAEIMKALECCRDNDNNLNMEKCFDECPYKGECAGKFMKDALELLNRKNAEIERLEREIPNYAVRVKVRNGLIYTKTLEDYDWLIGDISAEAIKEFLQKADERSSQNATIHFSELEKISAEMGVEL